MINDLQAAKTTLRNITRDRLARLDPDARRSQEVLINQHLVNWFETIARPGRGVLWAYWPALAEEPNFLGWLQQLGQNKFPHALPRMDWACRSLDFHQIDDPHTDLETTRTGVIQPRKKCRQVDASTVSAVLVPGLAFDLAGGRLGRGAGFYDRTLANLPPEIPRWSVAFLDQVVPEVPMAQWDQPLHGLILPTGLVRCK